MMLETIGLGVKYGAFSALKPTSFHLLEGQLMMVVGPNGAGKSTLLKAIAQTVPYQGAVKVLGEDARHMPARVFAKRLSALDQNHAVGYAFVVEELVRLGRYAHQGVFREGDPGGQNKVDEAIRLCGLEAIRRQNVLTLSGGELQRAFLAQVIAQDTPILLLDEPVSHLDLPYQKVLFDLIAKWLATPGRAALCVVHDLSLAFYYGTHALLMHEGICRGFGKIDDIMSPGLLNSVYGMDVPQWLAELGEPWRKMDKAAPLLYNQQKSEGDSDEMPVLQLGGQQGHRFAPHG